MKITRIILVAAGIAVSLAIIAWFLRDSLIQRISNPLLEDYGISVTDVSLDALATSDASIGYLELVHDKGTTIAIEDLTLPIGTTSSGSKTYTAKKVSVITSTRTEGELFELAQLIGQFLSLPDNLGDTEVVVSEFSLPPYPTVSDVRWVLADRGQDLQGSVADVAMSATVTRADATNYAIVFSLPTQSTPAQGHSVTANLQQGDQGILIDGTSSIDLPIWEPLGKLAGIIPHEIDIASGTAELQFQAEIPNDARQSPTVTAELTPSSPQQFTYAGTKGDRTSIVLTSGSSVAVALTFPDIKWSLQQSEASLLVTDGDWHEIPLTVSELSCRSGPVCSMNTRVDLGTAELPVGKIAHMEFVSSEDVVFPDTGVRIDVKAGATLSITGFASADTEVSRIDAQLVSTATLELVDAGWQLAADSIDAEIEGMSASDGFSFTTPLFLEDLLASELDDILSVKAGVYAPSSRANWNEQNIVLPGFKGNVSQQGNVVTADLTTIGLQQDAVFKVQHNVDTDEGHLDVGDAIVSFASQSLSNRVSPWPNDRDLVAGTVSFDVDANWAQKDSSFEFDARTSIAIEDLAGYFGDTAFAGLSTRLDAAYSDAIGFTAEPSTIAVALIETGLAVENLTARYTLDPNVLSVAVEDLRMTAFGGVISADPFSFRTDADRNTLILKAQSIGLTELLSLNEFEAIEVSGSIGAILPVTIEGDTVTIEDGTMTGDPAGGVIRYLPDNVPEESDASSIGLVTRALSNFEYETLTSDVNLSKEGDLNLKLKLTGRNPDLEEKRPVVLNLGVENNIPQMLKSLRAARAVEDILEKRLNK